MKKNRNSFFNDNPYQNQMINPNMPNYNMGMPNQMMMPNFQDIEERLAKIERQLIRLDKRISTLESNTINTDDFETSSNNMYML